MADNRNSVVTDHNLNSGPEMTYQSGAVQDHLYTTYPEVISAHQVPHIEHSAPEVVASTAPETNLPGHDNRYSTLSYNTVSPQPQSPPLHNYLGDHKAPYFDTNAYSSAPEAVPGQPGHDIQQPAYYNNGQPVYAPPQGMGPPLGTTSRDDEHKICGLRKKPFWILIILLAVVVIAAAVGGGVGGALAGKNKTTTTPSAGSTTSSTARASYGTSTPTSVLVIPGPTNTATGTFTPYAISTGIRTINTNYYESLGVCDTPTENTTLAIYTCPSTFEYMLDVSGNLDTGFTISNATSGTALPAFQNIKGQPPNGTDSKTDRIYWQFTITWQEQPCDVTRKALFLFGASNNEYGAITFSQSGEDCPLLNGRTAPLGTTCSCSYLSSTIGG